jgi:hypothetical protein
MRFKSLLISSMIFISGCGLLGPKEKPAEKSDVGATGCLDNSKDLVGRYVSGELSESEWKEAFGCINQSLNFFTQYVRGSYENSYSQGDMYTLISRFLIKNRPVNRELMRGAFNLKRALFGGDASEFTTEQIDLMQKSLDRLQAITSDLIPYLKLRQNPSATYDELLQMTEAFRIAGEQLADFVKTLPVGDLSDQALKILIDQLTETLDLNLIDGLDRKLFLSKWLIFNTRRDAFEPQDWPNFFRTAMTLGGIALTFKTAEQQLTNKNTSVGESLFNDYRYREFIWKLVLTSKPIIMESLTRHEGNTPFPIFDHLIDEIPDSFLRDVPKNEIKDMIRPLVRKLLLSKTKTGVDANVVETIFKLLENFVTDMGLIDRFYEKTGLDFYDVQSSVMKISLGQFEASLNGAEKERFTSIKNIILSYKPLLYRDTSSILHQNGVGYTRNQAIMTTALTRVAEHLHTTYGSGDRFFTEDDFRGILEEPAYKAILNSLTWVDATVPRFYAKRFQDMDLFTPVSNGDGRVTVPEMINYALMIISAGNLTTKMREEITPRCDQNLGQDLMGWTWVPIQCFRNEFYKNFSYWLTYFPRLKAYWETLTPEQKAKAAIWLEHGSRRNGYGELDSENDWVGKFDFGATAAVLHYTESLFTRFDEDNSEVLGKSELGNAYPVFKNLLYKKAKISNKDYVLKGIFTYIVKYRAMPVTNNASGLGKLGWWLASYTLQNYSADRLGVFNIVCQLAAPENTRPNPNDPTNSEDPDATNARICQ